MSKLNEKVERVLQEYDEVVELLASYETARGDYRMKKMDRYEVDSLRNEKIFEIELEELRRECDAARKLFCRQRAAVHDSMSQLIENREIDGKLLAELRQKLSQLPPCPPESDFLDFTLDEDSVENSSDEIVLSSSDEGDEKEQLLADVQNILEKASALREKRARMKEVEELRRKNKSEMFALRDRQGDTRQLQKRQRELFDEINALKIETSRLQTEIPRIIEEILPRVDDDDVAFNLLDILENNNNFADDEGDESSTEYVQPSQHQSRQPSRLPQPTSKREASKIQQPQSRPPSRLVQPQSRLPSAPPSRLPQPQFLQNPSAQRQPSKLPQLQRTQSKSRQLLAELQKQKSKLPPVSKIQSFPSLQRQQQPEQKGGEDARKRQPRAALKISESIGNVRKVGMRPALGATFAPSTDNVRPHEVNRIPHKNLSAAQRKSLHKQNLIKKQDELARLLANAEKQQAQLIAKMPLEKREQSERENVLEFIEMAINSMFRDFDAGHGEKLSHEHKMRILEEKLKIIFENMQRTMTQFRGASFTPDDNTSKLFIAKVLNHFDKIKDFSNYREILREFFEKMEYPKFNVETQKHPTTADPKRQQKSRPPSQTRPATATGIPSAQTKSKVLTQVQKLKNADLQKFLTSATTKQKLEAFTKTFCKIFLANQRTRHKSFEAWSKLFRENLAPIVRDLDAFYKSLPYPELKSFNRQQVETSLSHLLKHVYEQSKSSGSSFTSVKCRDLIVGELSKIMERQHLSELNASMGVFLLGVKELIGPYVKEGSAPIKTHVSSFRDRNKTRDTSEESMEVPSFGDDESLRSKMPVKELQSIYRQVARGDYVQPEIVGTAQQVRAMDRVTAKLKLRAQEEAARKRDQSLLRAPKRADGDTIVEAISEKIAPSSVAAFKRIVGDGELQQTLEIDDETLRALDIVLEHCEEVHRRICEVLAHRNRSTTLIDDPIAPALSKLVDELQKILFDGAPSQKKEIRELYRLFDRIDSLRLLQQLGDVTFSREECTRILDAPFAIASEAASTEMRAVLEFVKDLRYLERRYVTKVLSGEIWGRVGTPLEGVRLSEKKASKVTQPVRFVNGMKEIPRFLLEKDILYVACQLANRKLFDEESDEEGGEDATAHFDFVSKFVLSIARSFQEGKLSERDALRVLQQILFQLPCIPLSFFETFIFHVGNEFFDAIRFEDAALNALVRSEVLSRSQKQICAGERSDRTLFRFEQGILVNKIETFMRIYDNDLVTLATTINEAEKREKRRKKVAVAGQEVAIDGSGLLPTPESVDIATALKSPHIDPRLAGTKKPQGGAASAEISIAIESVMGGKLEESLEDSQEIAKISRKYQLQPSALKRKNYFQARGSDMPSWFPGFYAVFSDSRQSKPVAYASPLEILTHAWRTMAPMRN